METPGRTRIRGSKARSTRAGLGGIVCSQSLYHHLRVSTHPHHRIPLRRPRMVTSDSRNRRHAASGFISDGPCKTGTDSSNDHHTTQYAFARLRIVRELWGRTCLEGGRVGRDRLTCIMIGSVDGATGYIRSQEPCLLMPRNGWYTNTVQTTKGMVDNGRREVWVCEWPDHGLESSEEGHHQLRFGFSRFS